MNESASEKVASAMGARWQLTGNSLHSVKIQQGQGPKQDWHWDDIDSVWEREILGPETLKDILSLQE